MQERELYKKLDLLLKNPSPELLMDFQNNLRRVIESRPACPECGNLEVYRRGTNATRKIGRVQQYECKKCHHIYTRTTIERKEIWKKYPKCPKCKSNVVREGFWKWDGNKVQRYHCKKCGYYFRIERKRKRTKDDVKQVVGYAVKGTSVRMEAIEGAKRMSGTGFHKKVDRITKALTEINLFEIFKPKLSPIISQDIVWCSENWCYYIAKDPLTKVIINVLACPGKGYENAYNFDMACIQNIGNIPYIFVSDGDVDFDQALRVIVLDSKEYDGVRTIWLGRTPKEGGLTTWREQHTYQITQVGDNLLVEKGIINPKCEFQIDDKRHHTTTINTTLKLFEEYDARMVCLMTPAKYIHFKPFIIRFMNTTKNDGYVYHFVGTSHHGNPWIEALSKLTKKRHRWYYFMKKSFSSDFGSITLREKVRMMYYNVFLPQDSLGHVSPFEFAQAKFNGPEEAWDVICSYM